jgi:hypothetical protein
MPAGIAQLNVVKSPPSQESNTSPARHCKVVRGCRDILALREQILTLRDQTGSADDVTNDPKWFVKMVLARSSRPWVVLLFEEQKLVAAILLAERRIFGVPCGYLKAEGMDEGFLICNPDMRTVYLPLLMNGIFSRKSALIAHISQLADVDTAYAAPGDLNTLTVEWRTGEYHYRFKLEDTLEKTIAPHGAHTRRNIRYYLRKARAEGYLFISGLTDEQRTTACQDLRDLATHRISEKSAQLRETAARSTPNSFAMGIQGPNGDWLSYLVGWRAGARTFVLWQMNRSLSKNSSMGTAIRAFLMEEEIARGANEILFLGGSSAVFKRCCEVERSVHLIARRRGPRSWALSRLLERTVVPGHPLRRQE